MDSRLDLDYCPSCDLPTFDHETIVQTHGAYYHVHCFYNAVQVVSRENRDAPFRILE